MGLWDNREGGRAGQKDNSDEVGQVLMGMLIGRVSVILRIITVG